MTLDFGAIRLVWALRNVTRLAEELAAEVDTEHGSKAGKWDEIEEAKRVLRWTTWKTPAPPEDQQ